MSPVPTAPVAAAGLIGGFATGRATGRRQVAGIPFLAAGAWCARRWQSTHGPGVMGLLGGTYLAAFGLSHPLAKKIGPWPAVLAAGAVTAGVVYALADRSKAPW
jgi:hypothetical protein